MSLGHIRFSGVKLRDLPKDIFGDEFFLQDVGELGSKNPPIFTEEGPGGVIKSSTRNYRTPEARFFYLIWWLLGYFEIDSPQNRNWWLEWFLGKNCLEFPIHVQQSREPISPHKLLDPHRNRHVHGPVYSIRPSRNPKQRNWDRLNIQDHLEETNLNQLHSLKV